MRLYGGDECRSIDPFQWKAAPQISVVESEAENYRDRVYLSY